MAIEFFSRRFMLAGLGGAATVGAVSAARSGALDAFAAQIFQSSLKKSANVALASAAYAEWSAQVGTIFTAPGGTQMRLASVRAYADKDNRPGTMRQQGFVADFDLVKGTPLAAGLTRFAHSSGGTFDIAVGVSSAADAKPGRVFAEFN